MIGSTATTTETRATSHARQPRKLPPRSDRIHRSHHRYSWETITEDVRIFISDCQVCGMVKRAPQHVKPETRHVPIAARFTRWNMHSLHCLQDLKVTSNGYEHILLCIKSVARLMVAEPIKDLAAKPIAHTLFSCVFCTYGFPTEIPSDNPTFRHNIMVELAKLTDINHSFSLAYSSQLNRIVEQVIQTLQQTLQFFTTEAQPTWEFYLPTAVLAHNTTICNTALKDTPLFGHSPETAAYRCSTC